MTHPYTVALVVDSDFSRRLESLSDRVHTWIIATPDNLAAAKRIWSKLPESTEYSIERGVTTFDLNWTNDETTAWNGILESLDLHQNHYSHNPSYCILEVYGTGTIEVLRLILKTLELSLNLYGNVLRYQSTMAGASVRMLQCFASRHATLWATSRGVPSRFNDRWRNGSITFQRIAL